MDKRRKTGRPPGVRVGSGCGVLLLLGMIASCDDNTVINNYYNAESTASGDAGARDAGLQGNTDSRSSSSESDGTSTTSEQTTTALSTETRETSSPDAGPEPLTPGAPLVNASVADQDVDLFGTMSNHYWIVATPAQVDSINNAFQNRGGGFGGGWFGEDIYAPNPVADRRTVDHFLVTTPDGKTADYGEIQVKLVGQSTGRSWTPTTLPNFKLDMDDVTPGLRLGGYEHLRFNNGIVGSIFREKFVFDLYRALGYPAPLATYGWVSTTVWDPEVAVPYIVVESYKKNFCRNRADYFGGECPNMWEFASDLGYGVFDDPESCQYDQCDSPRARAFEELVGSGYYGSVTAEALSEYVDWERFHEFQCLSWIFGTSDDAIHGGNNTLWVERPDGKFQLLPYSIDISFFGDRDIGLSGYTTIPRICQYDEQCWADTIATCERLVDAFIEIDPVKRLDDLNDQLRDAGMLRGGDKQRYDELRRTLATLVETLPERLEYYRDNPDGNYCEYPYVNCDGSCDLPQYCYLCQDWYYEDNRDNTDDTDGTVPNGNDSDAPIVVPVPRAVDAPLANIVIAPYDPAPVPPPATTTTATPPPWDGGVPDGGTGQKPDFCYWDDPKRLEAYRAQ
jgi:hypothetical protein